MKALTAVYLTGGAFNASLIFTYSALSAEYNLPMWPIAAILFIGITWMAYTLHLIEREKCPACQEASGADTKQ